MVQFKVVLGAKDGKSYQKDLTEEESATLVGKVLRQKVTGDHFGFAGYEFLITGGSDIAGFPLRSDIAGTQRRKILAVSGIGLKKIGKGVRVRKTVSGNTITDRTVQVNLKILKEGSKPLAEIFPPKAK